MADLHRASQAEADRHAEPDVRKMMQSHVKIGFLFLSLSIGGIFLYMRSNQAITSLGLVVLVVVGVGILCWAEEMGSRVERFSDRAIPWRHGAASEEGVGGVLEALPENYGVFQRFATKKGTTDHIVVGPKGILTIDTKDHRGVVTQFRGTLLLDGQPFDHDPIRQAWAQSYAVRDLLAERGVCTLRAHPVIVFTDADVRVKERVRGVQILGLEGFQSYLEGLPVWMSERLSKAVSDCLWSAQDT
jgi:Nuclease-related domain